MNLLSISLLDSLYFFCPLVYTAILISSSSSMAQQPDIGPWPPLSSPSIRGLIPGFETLTFFTVRGRQPLAQPPTWRTRVSLLVWIIAFGLSGMGGTISSYATAGIC
jgi:hypothetical protein